MVSTVFGGLESNCILIFTQINRILHKFKNVVLFLPKQVHTSYRRFECILKSSAYTKSHLPPVESGV